MAIQDVDRQLVHREDWKEEETRPGSWWPKYSPSNTVETMGKSYFSLHKGESMLMQWYCLGVLKTVL